MSELGTSSSTENTTSTTSDQRAPLPIPEAKAFLREAARYFGKRETNGEDMAFWANAYNADNCIKIIGLIDYLYLAVEKASLNPGPVVTRNPDNGLIEEIKAALGTDENGANLVAVARDAHRAELELAALPTRNAEDGTTTSSTSGEGATGDQRPSALREALLAVVYWAQAKCPANEESPDPCPLCGATVEAGVCKAVDEMFPERLLAQINDALKGSPTVPITTDNGGQA